MDASSQYVWNKKFINEIEKRPGLWDQSLKSRDSQKQLWEELSDMYNNKSVDSLKRKYNNLKARFRQQLCLIPHTNDEFDIEPQSFESEWPHFRQMLFLLNEIDIKPNEKKKSTSTTEQQLHTAVKRKHDEDVDDIKSEDDDDDKQCGSNLPSTTTSTTVENKKIKKEHPAQIEVKPDIYPNPPPEDGLYHFLMGLYDCINELDPIRKINVQAKIYQMLSQEVAASRAFSVRKYQN